MLKGYENAIICLADDRVFQLQFTHRFKRSVETFANIFIGRIWEFVRKSNYLLVTRKTLVQNIVYSYMCRESSGTENLDAVVENSNMYIVINTVIPVDNSISDNLVNRVSRILDSLEPRLLHDRDLFYNFDDLINGITNKGNHRTLNCNWIAVKCCSGRLIRSFVPGNFYSSLRQNYLRLVFIQTAAATVALPSRVNFCF